MTKSVQAVERACDVMFVVASRPGGIGVSDIAIELGLPKSAVHRLLVALSSKSIVQRDPLTQQYRLHAKVLELALPFCSQQDILAISRSFLDGLRDRFLETSALVLREGLSYRVVAHSPSPHELRYCPTIGRIMPLHWGAFGKAILAALPTEEFETFLRDELLKSATSHTIVDREKLREERHRIREQGFSKSLSEVIESHFGVAASVRDHRGDPVASIGLGGPKSRIQQFDIDEMGREVREAAQHISNILGLQAL